VVENAECENMRKIEHGKPQRYKYIGPWTQPTSRQPKQNMPEHNALEFLALKKWSFQFPRIDAVVFPSIFPPMCGKWILHCVDAWKLETPLPRCVETLRINELRLHIETFSHSLDIRNEQRSIDR